MDAVLDQWGSAAPELDTAHLGVVARLHRVAHQLRQRAEADVLDGLDGAGRDDLAAVLRELSLRLDVRR